MENKKELWKATTFLCNLYSFDLEVLSCGVFLSLCGKICYYVSRFDDYVLSSMVLIKFHCYVLVSIMCLGLLLTYSNYISCVWCASFMALKVK